MNLASFAETRTRLDATTETLKKQIAEKEHQIGVLSALQKALGLLPGSWKDRDPGKYSDHWFFVKDAPKKRGAQGSHVQKFWPVEIIDNLKEARLGRKSPYGGEGRTHVPLGSLTDARMQPCPNCNTSVPVVGCYGQTEDSPEGDTWELGLHALCLKCQALYTLETNSSDQRFF